MNSTTDAYLNESKVTRNYLGHSYYIDWWFDVQWGTTQDYYNKFALKKQVFVWMCIINPALLLSLIYRMSHIETI